MIFEYTIIILSVLIIIGLIAYYAGWLKFGNLTIGK